MNKNFIRIFQGLLFILIIAAFIYIGRIDFQKKIVVDNERFDQDYKNVSKDNVFIYASSQEVYTKIKNGSGIIFMGFPENVWSGYYANILNETAKANNIPEILYYDFLKDRNMQSATYQSIVLNLAPYLPKLDDGSKNIYAPTLIIVKNGQIIGYDSETSIILGDTKPEEYWTEERIRIKKSSLTSLLKSYQKTT